PAGAGSPDGTCHHRSRRRARPSRCAGPGRARVARPRPLRAVRGHRSDGSRRTGRGASYRGAGPRWYPGRGWAGGRRGAAGGRTSRPAPATAATAAVRAGAARIRTGRTARPHGSPPPHDGPRTTHLGPGNGAVVRHRRGGGRDMRDSHRAEAERLLGRAVEEEVRRTGGRTDGTVLLGRARGALDA